MEFTIDRLGHLGDGIAPGPVYAAQTLPGEVIEGELDGTRIARPSIVTPSPDRVRPSCPHFRTCGGCALQHASDEFVAHWKPDVVRTALQAQGLPAPIRRTVTSRPGTRRRATFSGRRTKKGVQVGFHARASDLIVEVPDCKVLAPELLALRPALGELTRSHASRKGEISFAMTLTEGGIDLSVTGGKPPGHSDHVTLAAFAQTHDLARLTWDGETIVTLQSPVIRVADVAVTPPPGAFLQATPDGETALRNCVQEAVGDARRIVDLFAGCGTFALPLARQAEVHAVEGDPTLTATLDDAWRKAASVKKVTTETRDLFRRPLLPDELKKFDAAVIDPPRAGAEAQTMELAQAGPDRIAFVSCNPVTFARDAKTLTESGYSLDWIDVVDQFRWSSHVELAAQFTRGHMAAE